jgi:hypothetical protein
MNEEGNMNRIDLAISETLYQYPELGEDEIVESFIDFIEKDLVNKIAEVELPSPISLRCEQYKERRKKKKSRMSDEEFRTRNEFINVLHKLKLETKGYMAKINATSLFEPNGKIYYCGTELPKLPAQPFYRLRIEELERRINPSDVAEKLEAINNRTDIEKAFLEKKEKIDVRYYRGVIERLIVEFSDVANRISGNKVEKVTYDYDANFGDIIRVRLMQNAKDAFETWLKFLNEIDPKDYGINLRIDWIGEDNLSDNELVDYMVEVMLKSGVGPTISEKFDSVKAVREGWG